jgi:hypothetical protein
VEKAKAHPLNPRLWRPSKTCHLHPVHPMSCMPSVSSLCHLVHVPATPCNAPCNPRSCLPSKTCQLHVMNPRSWSKTRQGRAWRKADGWSSTRPERSWSKIRQGMPPNTKPRWIRTNSLKYGVGQGGPYPAAPPHRRLAGTRDGTVAVTGSRAGTSEWESPCDSYPPGWAGMYI